METMIMQMVTAFLGAMGFGLMFHLRLRHLISAAVGGFLTWGIYLVAAYMMEGIFFPSLIASAFATLFAETMARIRKAPATLYLIVAEVPLIPGSSLYYTMSYAVQNQWTESRTYGYQTMQYALGIALGMFLVWALYDMFGRILVLTVVTCLVFNGCSSGNLSKQANNPVEEQNLVSKKDIERTNISAEQPKEAESEAEILRFVDAWGEWHETEMNPKVEKHTYHLECLKQEDGVISYEGDSRYTMKRGVDVSQHQGVIDWEKVKAAGYDFAFVRMVYRGYGSTGSLNLDKYYYQNIVNAQAAGLCVGVYVFSQAVNEEEALEEAQLVIDNLENLTLELPVVFDPELIREDTARTDHVTGEQFTKNTIAFCEKIKEAGYEPMIYSNMVWEAFLFDLEQLSDYPIWYADYEQIPQTPYKFSFWQYSESGQVDGIQGAVDLDVWFCEEKFD